MELVLKNIRAHNKHVNGPKRFNREVMLSFMYEQDPAPVGGNRVHDLFLTQEMAEELHKELGERLAQNRLAQNRLDPDSASA